MKKVITLLVVVAVAVVGFAGRSVSSSKSSYVYEIGPVTVLGDWTLTVFNPTSKVRYAKVQVWNELGTPITVPFEELPVAAFGTSNEGLACNTACQRNFVVTVPSKAMIVRLRFDNYVTNLTEERSAGEWHFFKK